MITPSIMNTQNPELTIEKFNITNLTKSDLQNFYHIEKDSLAYFYNELKVCDCCWQIYNKKDVYGNSDNWQNLPVHELEKKYWSDFITPCCWSSSTDYRDESKIYDIQERLWKQVFSILNNNQAEVPIVESYCTVVKNNVNQVVWFCYGYIDNLENIYHKELWFHFTEDILEHPLLKNKRNTPFIAIWWGFMYQEYMKKSRESIELLFKLFREFCGNIDEKHLDTCSIFEWKNQSASFNIFKKLGAIQLDTHKTPEKYLIEKENIQLLHQSDLFIHPNMARNYINTPSIFERKKKNSCVS